LKTLFSLFFILLFLSASGQDVQEITFKVSFKGNEIHLHEPLALNQSGDSVQFETLKFYISDLLFFQDQKKVYSFPEKHLLIDFEIKESTVLQVQIPKNKSFNTLRFILGIDSVTQRAGAMGKDLDPVNGMYWTWQSGYIHVKIEGKRINRKGSIDKFHYHIGGYSSPFSTVQHIELNKKTGGIQSIQLELDEIISAYTDDNQLDIMQSGAKAKDFSKTLSQHFSVKQ
jgi:hypothetical protein